MKGVNKILSRANIAPHVLKAQYAPRGAIVIRANQIQQELEKPNHGYPFNRVIMCNIGNPQEVGQKPLTFHRQVLAACLSPNMLIGPTSPFPSDVQARAKRILDDTPCYTCGAYTHSQGYRRVRETVCEYIANRDGTEKPDIANIFLTDGASVGIKTVMQCALGGPKDGCLLPIPQYPLYSATISVLQASQIDYYLDEESGWSFDVKEAERAIKEAKSKGVTPKCMVVINPGNPTGVCLDESSIRNAIELAKQENMLLLADEVYQENIYNPQEKPFISFHKVMHSMGSEYYDNVELVSYHSVSKGVLGECGLRGGYMHLKNIDPSGHEQIYKLLSICLCSNTIGQIAMDLTVDKPKPGDPSYEVFHKEYTTRFESLSRKARSLNKKLSEVDGINCQEINGSMYAYPSIRIPAKAVKTAEEKGMAADAMYCMNLLEEEGICTVPGSGFGQKDGTYHFRSTLLPPEDEMDEMVQRFSKFHRDFTKRYS